MKLCSACLLGVKCRYDGKSRSYEKVIALSKKEKLLPVCPEELGGLIVPREPSERRGERVISKSGKDVTQNFEKGSKAILNIAKRLGIKEAILKQRSAACGSGQIYDGTFSRKVIKGNGITTELLRKNGISVISEEEIDKKG